MQAWRKIRATLQDAGIPLDEKKLKALLEPPLQKVLLKPSSLILRLVLQRAVGVWVSSEDRKLANKLAVIVEPYGAFIKETYLMASILRKAKTKGKGEDDDLFILDPKAVEEIARLLSEEEEMMEAEAGAEEVEPLTELEDTQVEEEELEIVGDVEENTSQHAVPPRAFATLGDWDDEEEDTSDELMPIPFSKLPKDKQREIYSRPLDEFAFLKRLSGTDALKVKLLIDVLKKKYKRGYGFPPFRGLLEALTMPLSKLRYMAEKENSLYHLTLLWLRILAQVITGTYISEEDEDYIRSIKSKVMRVKSEYIAYFLGQAVQFYERE